MDKYIGKMLDNRYEILEVIGRGGMAVVYKAKCHRLNRFVAVKILKEELAQDEEFRQRFRDESQAVAMLSHPNIVSVYDVSRTGDVEYIVMELIDGITLKDYLERKSPLGWKETSFFAVQIAKALEHAHSRGIIHRDIKPQNIMVLRDGTVKVADFGIARQAASSNTYNLREAIGSVHYVSPEQARGSHIDNRSDLYSLGVVMYEMLTGRLPFEGDTPLAVALQHINSIPLPPSDYVPDIPKTLEDIVMRAMAPQASSRYNNATEMIHDIEQFRNDQHYKIDVQRPAYLDEPRQRDPGETQVIQYSSELHAATQRANAQRRPAPARPVHTEPADYDEGEDEPVRTGGRKKRVSSSLIFTILAISIFVIGAGFFIIAVISPFGGKTPGTGDNDKNNDDPTATSVEAPALVGKTFEEVAADKSLQEQGITVVEKERVFDDEAKEGYIILQSPKAGKTMPEDKIIYVTVSKGPATAEMPDVFNKDVRQAEAEIRAAAKVAGVTVTIERKEEFAIDTLIDYVISSDPKEGEELKDGDVITLVVSKGPEVEQAIIPNLLKWSVNDAKNELVRNKLTVGKVEEVETDEYPAGTVTSTYPAIGQSVDVDTPVDLFIAKAKPVENASKTIVITLSPDESDPAAPIQVVVTLDGDTVYDKMHTLDEGEVSVKLTAPKGDHQVTVLQNGVKTLDNETVAF